MKKRLRLRPFTRKQKADLDRARRAWQEVIKPMQDAIRRSTQITGDDLKIIVR